MNAFKPTSRTILQYPASPMNASASHAGFFVINFEQLRRGDHRVLPPTYLLLW
jgi:hypothetical protein